MLLAKYVVFTWDSWGRGLLVRGTLSQQSRKPLSGFEARHNVYRRSGRLLPGRRKSHRAMLWTSNRAPCRPDPMRDWSQMTLWGLSVSCQCQARVDGLRYRLSKELASATEKGLRWRGGRASQGWADGTPLTFLLRELADSFIYQVLRLRTHMCTVPRGSLPCQDFNPLLCLCRTRPDDRLD